MIAVFTLLYIAGIWLFYVKMKVAPKPTNLAVCAVIGVVAIGAIVILWRFSAPMSSQVVVNRHAIQIVPQVQGPITKIVAQPNVPLKKGEDVLFEIQKDTYEFALEQCQAALAASEKLVEQQQAAIKVADATLQQAQAEMGVAKADLTAKEASNEKTPGAVSQLELAELRQQLAGEEAAVRKASFSKEEATFALDVATAQVDGAKAKLATAEFNLSQCTVYAPADGFVTNWQVREGSMVVPLPLAPMGTFIDTSDLDVVGVYSQNVVKNVKPGDKVEIAFKNHPGQIFQGTVDAVIAASGEGQFVTSGQLVDVSDIRSSGKFAVKIKLDDETMVHELPMGTAGVTAIYTDTGKPFHVISKVTIRIKTWMYYLLPF
ncbi:efflux RND transporter periplasmic adaptor subunit [Blastopirellula sp. JC732]|uniref:Efflux RND transporter periplasmic adaptor subunit n=1 Tax=Blastopirellula sediminis TaxID=2894196 RepID=A0A9X1MK46_9BACT|nr:efflux RND transporter periplasmic adaptor subunit [Blastopirellula sediminis]MCC9608987.1 efflux RND transporter periplasmic adaptor subunit [Blastopirellula sediminis]MCC9628236.1 efflux RND transporter periplasmic adaptor subunit [Blastopirellula sediminis]